MELNEPPIDPPYAKAAEREAMGCTTVRQLVKSLRSIRKLEDGTWGRKENMAGIEKIIDTSRTDELLLTAKAAALDWISAVRSEREAMSALFEGQNRLIRSLEAKIEEQCGSIRQLESQLGI